MTVVQLVSRVADIVLNDRLFIHEHQRFYLVDIRTSGDFAGVCKQLPIQLNHELLSFSRTVTYEIIKEARSSQGFGVFSGDRQNPLLEQEGWLRLNRYRPKATKAPGSVKNFL